MDRLFDLPQNFLPRNHWPRPRNGRYDMENAKEKLTRHGTHRR